MLYPLRTILLSACLMAAALMLSFKPAAAGFVSRPAFGSNAANASSWVAGGHAGYNWQQGAMVFGFETDLQATHLNSSMNGGLTVFPPGAPLSPFDFASTKASIDYYATARGRIGFTAGQWMLFGTAGAAYGGVDLSSTFATLGLQTSAKTVEERVGWVAGAGFEYILQPNVMLTFNYQYVDLGRVGLSSSTSLFGAILGQTATVRAQFQAAMVGMSWRFAPDTSPSPWAGGYVGGQAGGAWGNSASAVYNSFVLQ